MPVQWFGDKVEGEVFQLIVDAETAAGKAGRNYAKAQTPVRTGYAKRSVFFIVVDERGNIIGGDVVDENGHTIHFDAGQSGTIRSIVGSNECDYYVFIELGARGRPGKHILLRAKDVMASEFARHVQAAK